MNENNNKVLAIMDLAMKISQNSETDIDVDYDGTFNRISIRGYRRGWKARNADSHVFDDKHGGHAPNLYLDKQRMQYSDTTFDTALAELESIWEGICNGQAKSESESPEA
ncbi:MAG: hypothetical protein J1G06_08570 [Oscillospiraceae bacterium]|nr:hypothetical protein [Oscillospiraceae bacterium]